MLDSTHYDKQRMKHKTVIMWHVDSQLITKQPKEFIILSYDGLLALHYKTIPMFRSSKKCLSTSRSSHVSLSLL
jgi:hypothetical protein